MPIVTTETELRYTIALGEIFTIELKDEDRNPLNDSAIVENAVCLANGRGGLLLVGVEDNGRITSSRPRHGTYTDINGLEALSIKPDLFSLSGLGIIGDGEAFYHRDGRRGVHLVDWSSLPPAVLVP